MTTQQIPNILKIAGLAITSRVSVLLLGKFISLFFSRFDYSTSTSLLKSPFKYLESWDVVHYINISKNGYTHEHSLPFFPLVPFIVRVLSVTDILTTGVLINNLSFILSAMIFYKITRMLFEPKFSMLSTVFFIFNPASIIYSAYYTESIFTLLFFLGLFYTIHERRLMASVFFGISVLCRSNGALFIIFQNILYIPLTLIPISFFQLYSLTLIWAHTMNFKFIVPYSFVQAKYWEQGFLQFIRLRNTPNIIIGFPVILLSCFFLFSYFRNTMLNQNKVYFSDKSHEETELSENVPNTKTRAVSVEKKYYFYDIKLNVHSSSAASLHKNIVKTAGLLLLQTIMLIFLIHWNIAMRFIAHNPFIYWSAAYFAQKYSKNLFFRHVCTFFAVYGLMYINMFSCFYPPP